MIPMDQKNVNTENLYANKLKTTILKMFSDIISCLYNVIDCGRKILLIIILYKSKSHVP